MCVLLTKLDIFFEKSPKDPSRTIDRSKHNKCGCREIPGEDFARSFIAIPSDFIARCLVTSIRF